MNNFKLEPSKSDWKKSFVKIMKHMNIITLWHIRSRLNTLPQLQQHYQSLRSI